MKNVENCGIVNRSTNFCSGIEVESGEDKLFNRYICIPNIQQSQFTQFEKSEGVWLRIKNILPM
jgi:hypothetical protein